jgi:hypothetical protein
MKRPGFSTVLLVMTCLLLSPLLEWGPVLRVQSAHEALCGDHDCGCDGRAPVSTATCCCVGALRSPDRPAPPAGVDPTLWQLAWGDAPACRPATLHELPETRWATRPCGVDLTPEATRVASAGVGPLPASTWIPRAGSRRRRVLVGRVRAEARPLPPEKVPIRTS